MLFLDYAVNSVSKGFFITSFGTFKKLSGAPTRAGVQPLEGFCGLRDNPEIPPPLKLIALDLYGILSLCLSCFDAR